MILLTPSCVSVDFYSGEKCVSYSIALAIAVHGLAAIIWVGGMFFAYICLRPSMAALEPPQRLSLWAEVFRRFFPIVMMTTLALPLSGYFLIVGVYGGFANIGLSIHLMQGLGWVMIGLFFLLYFHPYRLFRKAVADQAWPVAAGHLNKIRQIVGINLLLGLVVAAIAVSGRFWN